MNRSQEGKSPHATTLEQVARTGEMLFYPCATAPGTERISQPVGGAMSHQEASAFLKKHYPRQWYACEAIPQPVTHPYFAGYARGVRSMG